MRLFQPANGMRFSRLQQHQANNSETFAETKQVQLSSFSDEVGSSSCDHSIQFAKFLPSASVEGQAISSPSLLWLAVVGGADSTATPSAICVCLSVCLSVCLPVCLSACPHFVRLALVNRVHAPVTPVSSVACLSVSRIVCTVSRVNSQQHPACLSFCQYIGWFALVGNIKFPATPWLYTSVRMLVCMSYGVSLVSCAQS